MQNTLLLRREKLLYVYLYFIKINLFLKTVVQILSKSFAKN